MSVIRSLAGGGSTGNILGTTRPAPTGPGLVPNIAGLQLLGGPVLDPAVGTLSATDSGADTASITGGLSRPWLPTDLGVNLVAWYDAQDSGSITHSSGAVSEWRDKSGNARHLAVGGGSPTYSATSFDGTRPGITTDGVDDSLLASFATPLTMPSIPTAAMALKRNGAQGGFYATPIYAYNNAGTAPSYVWRTQDGVDSIGVDLAGNDGGTVPFTTTETGILVGQNSDSSGARHFYKNGTAGTGGGTSSFTFFGAGIDRLQIGSEVSVRYYPGTFGEVLYTVDQLSDADRERLEGYLAWHWGLEGSLPSGHTYKAAAPVILIFPTGTLAATDSGADTASIAGTVLADPTGTLAATESGNDSASITGTVAVSGSLAATETGSDTASVAGTVLVAGSLAATEAAGSDTASVTGTVLVAGPLSATEAAGQDAASISGTVAVAGPLSATEGAGQDAASGTGSVLVAGPLAATESGADTASITGDVSDGASGSLAATETGTDTAAVAGDVAVSGSLDAQESGSDTAGLTGTVAVEGALAASETGQDTAEIREAAPVVAEEPRRGGPALPYSRRDRIAEYLELRRQRRARKRSLDELLEELLPTHSSEAKPAPIVSSPRSRDKAEDADLALERAADVARPSAQRIAAAAVEKAAEVITEDRQLRRQVEAKAKLIQTRRRRAIALLLAA